MKIRNLVFVLLVFAIVGCASSQPVELFGAIEKKGDVQWIYTIKADLSDGTHIEYIPLKRVTRPDFRVVQSGGSGTISFQVFASWSAGAATGAAASYDDVGLDFYGASTFTGATSRLIDDGTMFRTASWLKLVFTISGASADASYVIDQALELSRD
jgi:hypothetical protein